MKLSSVRYCWILLVILTIAEIMGVSYIGIWREWFWGAIANRDLTNFIKYLIYFSVVALSLCLISGYAQYLINYISLRKRKHLTNKALLSKYKEIEGGNQRVQEDCWVYPNLKISMGVGITKNILTTLVYSGILVYQLHWGYLIFPIVYAIIGIWGAAKIASPLVHLNYQNQNVEAKFRNSLRKRIYGQVHRNNMLMYLKLKFLQYYQTFYSQITIIIPYIILAPVYFSGGIVFGVLMQCASSITNIIESMSYIVSIYDQFNKYRASKQRLTELEVI